MKDIPLLPRLQFSKLRIKESILRILVAHRRHISFLLENILLDSVRMVLHERYPFDFGNIKVETQLWLQLIDLILKFACRRVVKDPFIVHEICKLDSYLLALGHVLLQLCHILFYLFGAYDSGEVVKCFGGQLAFVLESAFIGLVCWMSIETRSSNGVVEGILGPVALQSFYGVAPSQAIGC